MKTPPVFTAIARIPQTLQNRFWARIKPEDEHFLTQKNTYILPTGAGWGLLLTSMLLLVGSINFQLNLGYLLTFIVGGSAMVSLYLTHRNLSDLRMRLVYQQPIFADSPTKAMILFTDQSGKQHYGVSCFFQNQQPVYIDVLDGSGQCELTYYFKKRGVQPWPMLQIQSRFPIGVFRSWSWWRLGQKVVVYPKPEDNPPALPQIGRTIPHQSQQQKAIDDAVRDRLRSYQTGDALKHIAWKKSTHSDELVVRTYGFMDAQEIYLSLAQIGLPLEAALSRLCAWVLLAEKSGCYYELDLPTTTIKQNRGLTHMTQCLEALARYGS